MVVLQFSPCFILIRTSRASRRRRAVAAGRARRAAGGADWRWLAAIGCWLEAAVGCWLETGRTTDRDGAHAPLAYKD
jgi:hypothetical protein